MQELLPIIFVVVVFSVITNAGKRKTKQSPARPVITQPSTLDEDEEDFRRAMQGAQTMPAPRPASSETRAAFTAPQNRAYQPLQARVAATSEPYFEDSMGDVGSIEGMDPDHDHSLHLQLEDTAQSESALPPVTSLLTRNELVKSVVLSEILNRPTMRRWGSR